MTFTGKVTHLNAQGQSLLVNRIAIGRTVGGARVEGGITTTLLGLQGSASARPANGTPKGIIEKIGLVEKIESKKERNQWEEGRREERTATSHSARLCLPCPRGEARVN